MKEDYQKAFKKLTLFFFKTQSLLMNNIIKNKRGLELVTSSPQVTIKVQKNSIISYVLSDQVWWSNIKWFWVIPKITPANLCKPIHEIIYYSTSILFLWICEVWKGRGKITKILISWERKELFWWNKNHFL